MKRKIITVIAVFMMLMMGQNVKAILGRIDASDTVYENETVTVKVVLADTAAWNIRLSATGNVKDGCSLVEAEPTADGKNTNKEFQVTCTATSEGEIHLLLTGDITDQDENNIDINEGKTIQVVKKSVTPQDDNKEDEQKEEEKTDGKSGEKSESNNENQERPVTPKTSDNGQETQPENTKENPKTGVFAPVAVIVGLATIGSVIYLKTRKRNIVKI